MFPCRIGSVHLHLPQPLWYSVRLVWHSRACACRCIYVDEDGAFDFMHAMYETTWHSMCHVLSMNVFTVYALPSRVVVAAYALLVLIICNTYTANLAAFLTVDQLDTSIKTVDDLWGKRVATFPTYHARLNRNHHIATVTDDGALPPPSVLPAICCCSNPGC
jgi:hypothetical protein